MSLHNTKCLNDIILFISQQWPYYSTLCGTSSQNYNKDSKKNTSRRAELRKINLIYLRIFRKRTSMFRWKLSSLLHYEIKKINSLLSWESLYTGTSLYLQIFYTHLFSLLCYMSSHTAPFYILYSFTHSRTFSPTHSVSDWVSHPLSQSPT